MNSKLLLLIPVVAATVFGLSFTDFANYDQPDNVIPLSLENIKGKDPVGVKDNVEVFVHDRDGNLTFHDTTHNKVITHGENCVAKMIFGTLGGDEAGTSVCVGAINAGFRYIGLGESSTAVADTDTDLLTPAIEAGLSTPILSTATWTNSTTGSFSSVLLSSAFTNTGASETINEVALFNETSTATRGMYARAVISPAALNNGDTITVNWTFETGSAAVP